jgi:hypothetical protein
MFLFCGFLYAKGSIQIQTCNPNKFNEYIFELVYQKIGAKTVLLERFSFYLFNIINIFREMQP